MRKVPARVTEEEEEGNRDVWTTIRSRTLSNIGCNYNLLLFKIEIRFSLGQGGRLQILHLFLLDKQKNKKRHEMFY